MNWLKEFFWFCSGANKAILKRCPTEHIKYAGIGGTVFFTGLFAAISGGYALYFVFNDVAFDRRIIASIFFGLLWGSMIFNLDRYIVSSMRKKSGSWEEIKLALPRFILAAIIAFVISKPLELQIFHTSIEYELETMKQEELKRQEMALSSRFEKEIINLEIEIKRMENEISYKTTQRDKLSEEARKEADGTGGSGVRGASVIFQIKKKDADNAQSELEKVTSKNLPLIIGKQQELDLKRRMADSIKTTIKRGSFDGFDKRLDALGRVSQNSATLQWASWFIMLLFLSLEISPILVKLLSSRGPYDDHLEVHEKLMENNRVEKISQMEKNTNEILQDIHIANSMKDEEMESSSLIHKRIGQARTEVAEAMIRHWKESEINRIQETQKNNLESLKTDANKESEENTGNNKINEEESGVVPLIPKERQANSKGI